jgi:hypothetical protein
VYFVKLILSCVCACVRENVMVFVCMYVCICMRVWLYVCKHDMYTLIGMCIGAYVCMYSLCMCVRLHNNVCMLVCVYVCTIYGHMNTCKYLRSRVWTTS